MANQKTNMEILNEIRKLRNDQLRELKDNSVFYTRVMSLEKGEKTDRQFYRIMEEYNIGENQSEIRELFYEYGEDGPALVASLDSAKGNILLPNGLDSDDDLNKWLDGLDEDERNKWLLMKEDIEKGREIEKTRVQEQALKLGIFEEEIEGLSEIDIYKKVDERVKEYNENNKLQPEKEQENEMTTLPSEAAQKAGIIGMNSISLDQKVGMHGETLRGELGLTDKEYSDIEYLEIIPAYKIAQLDGKVHDVPFLPVGRKKDGEIVVFPQDVCTPYKGENNTPTTIDGKDESVRTEKSNCMIRFPKSNTRLIIDQKSPYGIVDASLGYNTRDNDGVLALDLQTMKEDGNQKQNTEGLEIMNQRDGGVDNEEEVVKRAREHEKAQCKEAGIKEVDGDENTGHIHFNPESEEQRKAIDEIIEKSAGGPDSRISKEEAEKLFKSKLEEHKGEITPKDAAEEVLEEMNEHTRNRY